MKLIITILLSLVVATGVCKSPAEVLMKKGYEYCGNQKYEHAIRVFKQIRMKYPYFQPAIISYQIGDCFKKKGYDHSAEKYFLLSTNADLRKDSFDYGKNRSANALGELYFKQRKYRLALYYYNATETIYRKRFPKGTLGCGTGKFLERLTLSLNQVKCFDALNIYDSVVLLLSEHMFQKEPAMFSDSEYNDLSRTYAKAVINCHGKEEARNKLQQAVDHLYFEKSEDPAQNEFLFTSSLTYFGQIELFRHFNVKKDDATLLTQVTKENMINILRTTPAYRYIMYDDCDITTPDQSQASAPLP